MWLFFKYLFLILIDNMCMLYLNVATLQLLYSKYNMLGLYTEKFGVVISKATYSTVTVAY